MTDPDNLVGRRDVVKMGALAGVALPLTAARDRPLEIIDIHVHVQSADTHRYPPHPFGGGVPAEGRRQSVEQLRAEIAAAGVAKAAVVQVSSYYGFDNSYLIDSIATDRGQFTGVCCIDVLAPDAVATLQRLTARGASGLRIFTAGDSAALADPRSFPVWAHCEQHQIPVAVQTTIAGLATIRLLARRFSGARILLDHMARPRLDDGPPYREAQPLLAMADLPNVYLKLTSPAFELSRTGRATPDTFFPALVAAFGAERLAYGSNLPATEGPMARLVANARTCLASLSAADEAMIMGGTAKRLYPALASA